MSSINLSYKILVHLITWKNAVTEFLIVHKIIQLGVQ